MGNSQQVERFVKGICYKAERSRNPNLKNGHYPFVTISRQAGAGGHSLAEALLTRMEKEPDPFFKGWQMFDQELCKRISEDPKLKVSMQSLLTEEYRTQVEDLLAGMIVGGSSQEAVVKKTFETVRTLATFGKVILVGRAGSCVTVGLPLGVHVRLVAPEPVRIQRMSDRLHLSPEDAVRKAVRKQDQDRARLVKDYFNRDIDDPLLYDTVWNTGRVPVESVASCIITMIQHRISSAMDSGDA